MLMLTRETGRSLAATTLPVCFSCCGWTASPLAACASCSYQEHRLDERCCKIGHHRIEKVSEHSLLTAHRKEKIDLLMTTRLFCPTKHDVYSVFSTEGGLNVNIGHIVYINTMQSFKQYRVQIVLLDYN